MDRDELPRIIANLNVYKAGERRAPHKPLLVLLALARLENGQERVAFEDVEDELRSLLNAWAPPVKSRQQPELPYWHLASDGIWNIPGADRLPRQAGGFPRMASLRESEAGFTPEVLALLQHDPKLKAQLVDTLLEQYFPSTAHDELLAAIGLDREALDKSIAEELQQTVRRRRDPQFRNKVLNAYEHQCAASGFRAALGSSYFGCEAAHVQWHAYDGPDTVSNGLCLEPTLHKLFDAGAWSLTDDRRILVSKNFTGSDTAIQRLRSLHGQAIRPPLPGESPVSVSFIRWHRKAELGGVFRKPALPLV